MAATYKIWTTLVGRFAIFAPAAFVVVSAAMLMFVPVDPPWIKSKTKKLKTGDGEDGGVAAAGAAEEEVAEAPGMLEAGGRGGGWGSQMSRPLNVSYFQRILIFTCIRAPSLVASSVFFTRNPFSVSRLSPPPSVDYVYTTRISPANEAAHNLKQSIVIIERTYTNANGINR